LAPENNEIEVSIFGAGFGESILIHLGNNNWLLIDSAWSKDDKKSAAIVYLESIGVSAASVIRLIIVSHWHDDHIKGMGDVIELCSNAEVVVSAALTRHEFNAFVAIQNQDSTSPLSSGVREINKIQEILASRTATQTVYKKAIANRILYTLSSTQSGHGLPVTVTSLSPSDRQIDLFYQEITRQMPEFKSPKRRAVSQSPNHTAVVLWVKIGDQSILLGSDLEEAGTENLGWSAVVASHTSQSTDRASIFKVPHHGSANADNTDVWSKMLQPSNKGLFVALTPYNKGAYKLPRSTDLQRITAKSDKSYITTPGFYSSQKTLAPAVKKTLREMGREIKDLNTKVGQIRLRSIAGSDSWAVELLNGACYLRNFTPQS